MESVDDHPKNSCGNNQLQSSSPLQLPSNDDTNHIDIAMMMMINSSWKGSWSGGGGGGKMSTMTTTEEGKVSMMSDTAEITLSTSTTRRNHPSYESSFSSSLTSSRHLEMITHNEYDPDPPLPDEIPRFIYTRIKTNTTTTDQGESLSSLPSSQRPLLLHRTRSMRLPRFLRRRTASSPPPPPPPPSDSLPPHDLNIVPMNDDSENTSDLLGGGMTLVSL